MKWYLGECKWELALCQGSSRHCAVPVLCSVKPCMQCLCLTPVSVFARHLHARL